MAICGLSGLKIFPHYLINCKVFGQNLFKIKRVFNFFYNFRLKYFKFLEDIVINYIGLYEKSLLLCSDLNILFFSTDLKKIKYEIL
jgi:hypothetical protein